MSYKNVFQKSLGSSHHGQPFSAVHQHSYRPVKRTSLTISTMRLLTHNFLQSTVRGTTKGYPLAIEATSLVVEDSPVNLDMVKNVLPKLDYDVLKAAAQGLGHEVPPSIINNGQLSDEDAGQLYKILFDVHVLEGFLVCPDSGRKFPITQGIPNMILHEDEV